MADIGRIAWWGDVVESGWLGRGAYVYETMKTVHPDLVIQCQAQHPRARDLSQRLAELKVTPRQ
jgi:hypothetical protein